MENGMLLLVKTSVMVKLQEKDVIIQLIIDDGVSSKGHRKNCFKPEFGVVGIYDGEHKQYETQSVFDFAGSFEDKPGVDASAPSQNVLQQQPEPQQNKQPDAPPAQPQVKDPDYKITKDALTIQIKLGKIPFSLYQNYKI